MAEVDTGGRTLRRAAVAVLVAGALTVGAGPDLAAAAGSISCDGWRSRQIDLTAAAEAGVQDRADWYREASVTGDSARQIRQQAHAEHLDGRNLPDRMRDVAETVRGRYAGCGLIDAIHATTSHRTARVYAQAASAGQDPGR